MPGRSIQGMGSIWIVLGMDGCDVVEQWRLQDGFGATCYKIERDRRLSNLITGLVYGREIGRHEASAMKAPMIGILLACHELLLSLIIKGRCRLDQLEELSLMKLRLEPVVHGRGRKTDTLDETYLGVSEEQLYAWNLTLWKSKPITNIWGAC
ncbi:7-hydroxymethyl chlorophyll a reductase [Spatholobus suberectus]|nr:7-hydroxymethyl chlorophyll a reductase [Spatholobus suberectus]